MKNLLHPLCFLPIFMFLLTIGFCIFVGSTPPSEGTKVPAWVFVLAISSIPNAFYTLIAVMRGEELIREDQRKEEEE